MQKGLHAFYRFRVRHRNCRTYFWGGDYKIGAWCVNYKKNILLHIGAWYVNYKKHAFAYFVIPKKKQILITVCPKVFCAFR